MRRNAQFDNYAILCMEAREAFLEELLGCGQLDVDFCLTALKWEIDPQAQWLLIYLVGIKHLSSAVPLLLAQFEKPDVELETIEEGMTSLHGISAWSLGKIGAICIDPLLVLMNHEKPSVRKCAADALGEIGDSRRVVLEALANALSFDCSEVALWAALSLAKLGESALSYLHQIVFMQDTMRMGYALDAIVKIGSLQSKPVLNRLMTSNDADIRHFYMKILEQNSLLRGY